MATQYTAVQVLTMAVELEKMGKLYYDAIIDGLSDSRAKEIFQILADDEVKHEQLFQEMLDDMEPSEASEIDDPRVIEYFRALIDKKILPTELQTNKVRKELGDPAAGIRIALTLEKDAILFFHEMLVFAPDEDQPTIKQIIDEERDHLLRILKLKTDMKL